MTDPNSEVMEVTSVEEMTRRSDMKVTRMAWAMWRGYIEKRTRWKEIESLVTRVRRLNLIRFYIELWLHRCRMATSSKAQVKYQRAEAHKCQSVKRRAIRVWMEHCRHRKRRRTDADHKRKAKAFSILLRYVIQRKLYREHVKAVTSFYEKYLLRTVLEKWALAHARLIESRVEVASYDSVSQFYNKKLLVKCLTTWKGLVHEERARMTEFALRAANTITQHILDTWRRAFRERLFLNAMEDKADKWRCERITRVYLDKMVRRHQRLVEQNRRIDEFRSLQEVTLMRRAFEGWTIWIRVGREKKEVLEHAREYRERRLLSVMFRRLRRYAARKMREKLAMAYRERRMTSKMLTAWMVLRERRHVRLERVALIADTVRRRVLSRALAVLKEGRDRGARKVAAAAVLAERRLAGKVLREWRRRCAVKQTGRAILDENRRQLNGFLVREVLAMWQRLSTAKVALRSNLEAIRWRHEMRTAGETLRRWRDFSRKMRLLGRRIAEFSEARLVTLARDHVLRLSTSWKEMRAVREKEELASRARKVIARRKCLRKWFAYVTWKKGKLRKCSEAATRTAQKQDNLEGCPSVRSKRKPPMIPLYLRSEYHP